MNTPQPQAFDQAINRSISHAAKEYEQERPSMMQSFKNFLRQPHGDNLFPAMLVGAAGVVTMVTAAAYGSYADTQMLSQGLPELAKINMGVIEQAFSNMAPGLSGMLEAAKTSLGAITDAALPHKLSAAGFATALTGIAGMAATKIAEGLVGAAPVAENLRDKMDEVRHKFGIEVSREMLEKVREMDPVKRLLTIPGAIREAASIFQELKSSDPSEIVRSGLKDLASTGGSIPFAIERHLPSTSTKSSLAM